jgi:integrase
VESLLEIDPLTEFFSAIMNANTRRNYEKDLGKFFDYLEIEGSLQQQSRAFVSRAKGDYPWAMAKINAYIQLQKERVERKEITESRIHNLYKPIKLFCEENDILLNWKKLARRIPKRAKAANDRAPEVEEIRKILAYPDRRIKPACLIMESSGIRIGAFDYLKWGDIEPIEKNGEAVAARIKIYAGTNDEYFGFITPEAFRAVKEYIDYRKEQGERIAKESPLIRDLIRGDRWGKAEPHIPTRLKSTGVKRLVEDALKIMGVRGTLARGAKRHEFQTDHGFRKFFKSVCERRMKSLHVEILLGHTVGLADNYYRPRESELLEEYVKAIPDLTLLEPTRVVSPEDIQSLNDTVADVETKNKVLESKVAQRDQQIDFLIAELKSQRERLDRIEKLADRK